MNLHKKLLQTCSLSMLFVLTGCNNILAEKPSVNTTDDIITFTEKYAASDVVGAISLSKLFGKNYASFEHSAKWAKRDCWHSNELKAKSTFALYCNAHGGEFFDREEVRWQKDGKNLISNAGWCRNTSAPYQPLFIMETVTQEGLDRCGVNLDGEPYYEIWVYTPKDGGSNTDQDWIDYAKTYGFVTKEQENQEKAQKEQEEEAKLVAEKYQRMYQQEQREKRKKDAPLLLKKEYRGTQICSFIGDIAYLEDSNPSNGKIKVIDNKGKVFWEDAKQWYICGH